MNKQWIDVRNILLVALIYAALARFGLIFAVLPGFASPLWPAAGFGLVAVLQYGWRAAIGVALGSMVANFPGAEASATNPALWRTLAICLGIGTGAGLQALFGAWLVRKWVIFPTPLEQLRDIGPLVVLGGPVACLVSATCGIATLFAAGIVYPDNLMFRWFNWWGGDMLGVMTFSPVMLLLVNHNNVVTRQRKAIVAVFLTVIMLSAGYVYFSIKRYEEHNDHAAFASAARDLTHTLKSDMEEKIDILQAISGFIMATPDLNYASFTQFGSRYLDTDKTIETLGWIQYVRGDERAAFEQRKRAEGISGYMIKDLLSDNTVVRAGKRSEYLAAAYVIPRKDNEMVLGFDPLSRADRKSVLLAARDSGEARLITPVALVQKPKEFAMLLSKPVYYGEPHTLEERRRLFRGFVSGAFMVKKVLTKAIATAKHDKLTLTISLGEGENALVLYNSRSDAEGGDDTYIHPQAKRHLESFDLAGSVFTVEVIENNAFLSAQQHWSLWVLLLGEVIFTAMMAACGLLVTGRTDIVRRLVRQKTQALVDSEQSLQRMVNKLTAMNEQLEQFAYVASHDLREPIRIVSNFTEMLEVEYGDRIDEAGRQYMGVTRQAARQMNRMITDLLEYGRLSHEGERVMEVDCNRILSVATENLGEAIRTSGAVIHADILPTLMANPTRLASVFQNLIGNALKYQVPGNRPIITIACERKESGWQFSFADNGIGIRQEYFEDIFKPFRRLHGPQEYSGTGIGLALCKRIIETMGGSLWLTSEPGRGTTFFFTLAG